MAVIKLNFLDYFLEISQNKVHITILFFRSNVSENDHEEVKPYLIKFHLMLIDFKTWVK